MHGVKRLLYLGSSCIYPRDCPQPIREEYLLSGPLEPTNEPYAIAKISGIRLCQAYRRQYGCDFISAMPTNLYGPGRQLRSDELARGAGAHAQVPRSGSSQGARSAVVWGTGTPRREFLHVDDLADACLFLMEHYDGDDHINVGTGEDLSIRELAERIRDIVAPERRDHVRHVEAGRHAAQAARRRAGCTDLGLASPHRAPRRARIDLRLVLCADGRGRVGVERRRRQRRSSRPVAPRSHESRVVARGALARQRCGRLPRAAHCALGRACPIVEGRTRSRAARITVGSSASTGSSCRADSRVLELGCGDGDLLAVARAGARRRRRFLAGDGRRGAAPHPDLQFVEADAHDLSALDGPFDVIVLSDLLHDVWDVQGLLDGLHRLCHPGTRVVMNFYSRLWEIPLTTAARVGLARPVLKQNWLTVADVDNLLHLSDFRVVRTWQEVLLPAAGSRSRPPLQSRPRAAVGHSPSGAGELSCSRGPLRRRPVGEPPAERVGDRSGPQRSGQHPRGLRAHAGDGRRHRADLRRGAFVGRHLRRDRAGDRRESAATGAAAPADRPGQGRRRAARLRRGDGRHPDDSRRRSDGAAGGPAAVLRGAAARTRESSSTACA